MRHSDNWLQNIKLHLFSNYTLPVVPFSTAALLLILLLSPISFPRIHEAFSIFSAFCAFLHPLINSPSSHFLPIHWSRVPFLQHSAVAFVDLLVVNSPDSAAAAWERETHRMQPRPAPLASLLSLEHITAVCTCQHVSPNI